MVLGINMLNLGQKTQMAQAQCSLSDLADGLGITIDEVIVSCYYCGKWLGWQDKVLFQHSNLLLHVKDDFYYAACYGCVRATAKIDFIINYEKFVSIEEAEAFARRAFVNCDVRCWGCLRILNPVEKADVVSERGDVAIVRGNLRAKCTLCKIGLS